MARLVGEPGWVSMAQLVELTGLSRTTLRQDLELIGQYLPLQQEGENAEARWVLAGREVEPRDQVAYELGASLPWPEVADEAGYASAGRARAAARRYALREWLPWPPAR